MNKPDPATARDARGACGQSAHHESAWAQVAGAAPYVDDIPEVRGTLHAAPILSSCAHGRLKGVDSTAALSLYGVRAIILASDVPGNAMLAAFAGDEPVFAIDTVQHVGQVIGLVVADTVMLARRAARLVKPDIEPLPAVLNVRDALARKVMCCRRSVSGAGMRRPPWRGRRTDSAVRWRSGARNTFTSKARWRMPCRKSKTNG
jgi:xanthine dehydrogenase large subunit